MRLQRKLPVWLKGLALSCLMALGNSAALAAESRVVVGVIDTAINPYHDFFYSNGGPYIDEAPSAVTPEVLAEFGIDNEHILHLTRSGDFAADYAADQALWSQVNQGELYWIAGTNILAISFKAGGRILLPENNDDSHGVAVTAALLRSNPQAIALFVEKQTSGLDKSAEIYTFNHPLVDIVSTSYGPIGSLPGLPHMSNSYVGVVEQGKLHFGASDNTPALSLADGTSGPWWSIGISGFEEHSSEGKQLLAGTFTDFVADYRQELPYCHDCESELQAIVTGTSFATPLAAGAASRVLLQARQASGHLGSIDQSTAAPSMVNANGVSLTNWQIRRALEEAAYVPTLNEYDWMNAWADFALPTLPMAPYLTVSWGLLTQDTDHQVIAEALAQLGIAGSVTRRKDSATCQYMSRLMQLRKLYWNNLYGSESRGSSDFPYLGCAD